MAGCTPIKGWPGGSVGPGNGTEGSTKLASSWIVGSRQPRRFPTLAPLQWNCAPYQIRAGVLGDFSQTSPVSRSRTAALLQFNNTMNRGQVAMVVQSSFW